MIFSFFLSCLLAYMQWTKLIDCTKDQTDDRSNKSSLRRNDYALFSARWRLMFGFLQRPKKKKKKIWQRTSLATWFIWYWIERFRKINALIETIKNKTIILILNLSFFIFIENLGVFYCSLYQFFFFIFIIPIFFFFIFHGPSVMLTVGCSYFNLY